jgi:hypothetical protein
MPPALARERVDPPSFANLCVPARKMSVRDQAGVPLRPEILCELTRLSVAVDTTVRTFAGKATTRYPEVLDGERASSRRLTTKGRNPVAYDTVQL